jgi:ABC-type amino acid transport substrate-binding protein
MSWHSVLFLFAFTCSYAHAQLNIRYIAPFNAKDEIKSYSIQMLKQVCQVLKRDFTGCRMIPVTIPMLQQRQLKSLTQDKLDIVWTVTTTERERNYRAIRIPLMKGLIGYRIAVTNDKNLAHFSDLTKLPIIKKLSIAQGHDWPDTQILRANGFSVIEITQFNQIYPNVSRGAYDFTLRGVLEVYPEFEDIRYKNIHIDQNLLFKYPSALYFFVRKDDKKLAEAIEAALIVMIREGTFDQLFNQFNDHKTLLEQANLQQRQVIELKNSVNFSDMPTGFDPWYKIPKQ